MNKPEKPINLLAISASPRKNGNSMYLLERALKVLDDLVFPVNTQVISFSGKKIAPCVSCLCCKKNGGDCVIKDDFQSIRETWLRADCILYSIPVYVAGIPGQLKCFIDRLSNAELGLYPVRGMRHMKPIGVITQGGDFPGGQEYAMFDIMRHAAMASCIYTAPDGYFFGSGGWAGSGSTGTEMKRKTEADAPEMRETLKTAESIVRRIVEIAAMMNAGAEFYRDLLSPDPRYAHYFQLLDEKK